MTRTTRISTLARDSVAGAGKPTSIEDKMTAPTLSTRQSNTLDQVRHRYVIHCYYYSKADNTADTPLHISTIYLFILATTCKARSEKERIGSRLNRQHCPLRRLSKNFPSAEVRSLAKIDTWPHPYRTTTATEHCYRAGTRPRIWLAALSTSLITATVYEGTPGLTAVRVCVLLLV